MDIDRLLKSMVTENISDLHFKVGAPPRFRLNGQLHSVASGKLTEEDIQNFADYFMNEEQKERFSRQKELDVSYELPGVCRFRANIYKQKGTIALSLRVIPSEPESFEELNLPVKILEKLCAVRRGLILLTGITGAGKTTTMNAMINYMNEKFSYNIITVEDPIEFFHHDKKCSISQREVGSDTNSFTAALEHVLRQNPDVVAIGELKTPETINACLIAAETGHLVLSTIHTVDTVQTVNRIVDLYPPHLQQPVRQQLANVLKAIVAQRLLSRIDREGRVPADEIFIVTSLVKKLILEGATEKLYKTLEEGAYYGMQTFDQGLLSLYKAGKISIENALENSTNPDELMLAIRGVKSGGGVSEVKPRDIIIEPE